MVTEQGSLKSLIYERYPEMQVIKEIQDTAFIPKKHIEEIVHKGLRISTAYLNQLSDYGDLTVGHINTQYSKPCR